MSFKAQKVFIVLGKFLTAVIGTAALIVGVGVFLLWIVTSTIVPEFIGRILSLLFYPLVIGCPALFIYLLWRKWGVWYVWLGGLIGFFVILLTLLVSIGPHPHRTLVYRDGRKFSLIAQYRVNLEIYWDEEGKQHYPPLDSSCVSLESLVNYDLPGYLLATTSPYAKDVFISVSSDKKHYVLKANLEDKDRAKNMINDVDGNVFGCDCDD